MSTLTVEKKNAIVAFINADDKGKKLLSNLFPNEKLSGNIMDMVKTYEDALALDAGDPEDDAKFLEAVKQARVITRVLNGEWKADYTNDKQQKWHVWMRYDSSLRAFVFGITSDDCTDAHAGTGSRHAFKDQPTAKYFATQFADVINAVLL